MLQNCLIFCHFLTKYVQRFDNVKSENVIISISSINSLMFTLKLHILFKVGGSCAILAGLFISSPVSLFPAIEHACDQLVFALPAQTTYIVCSHSVIN